MTAAGSVAAETISPNFLLVVLRRFSGERRRSIAEATLVADHGGASRVDDGPRSTP